MTGIAVLVDEARCNGCGDCVERCPTEVLALERGKAAAVRAEDCQACFLCVIDCPVDALQIRIARVGDEPRWCEHWSRKPPND